LLESHPDFQLIGEAGDYATAAIQLTTLRPDVALIDLTLGSISGLGLIRLCRTLKPSPAPVVLTLHREESTFDAALKSGAAAYVLKEHTNEDVPTAIRAVMAGRFFLTQSLREFEERRRVRDSSSLPSNRLKELSPTERRVLRLISTRRSTKEIAQELCVSPKEVEVYRDRLCDRLNLPTKAALDHFAQEQGPSL
jgi:DNA-binding NarL/FixJ family response regulator